jgi:hypothetical protein
MVTFASRDAVAAPLSRGDVVRTVEDHYSSREMREVLESVAANGEKLLLFMGRFFQYASAFGVGQTALASQVAARKDLFSCPGEVGVFADASMTVAEGIFSGAIDEFGDREIAGSPSHRALALATLKGMARFLRFDLAELSRRVRAHAPTRNAAQKVSRYYGVNVVIDEASLFRGIGFHLGTEVLGEDENRVLDDFFCTRCPDLMTFLDRNAVEINGVSVPANVWFKRHIVAEADHFATGLRAANLAFEYYSGSETRQELVQWVLEGVQAVASMQREVMRTILQESSG